jgi:hypothetical protein
VVKKDQVTFLHVIADEIPCLVIPDAVPVIFFTRGILQVIDAERIGFALDQPVVHFSAVLF